MRHKKGVAKLSRESDHRRSLLRNLAGTLALHKKVTTTTVKAKALVAYFEHLIALARRNESPLHAIRLAKRHFYTEPAQRAFVEQLKSLTRPTGNLRTTKVGFRRGDGSEVSLVQFVS